MTPSIPPETASGFTVETLLDGHVVCFTIVSSTRSTVDEFVNTVIRLQSGKSLNVITYFVFDFTMSFAAFNSQYGRARMTELTSAMQDYTAICAIILPQTFMTHIAQFFLKFLPQKDSITRLFTDRQSGLDWLEQVIAESNVNQRKIL